MFSFITILAFSNNKRYLYILEKGIIIFWGYLLQNVGFLQICPF